MKTPDKNTNGSKRTAGANAEDQEKPVTTIADFPINESLLLDEVDRNRSKGFEHIQLETDDSAQHTETRGGAKVSEETMLDEVAREDRFKSPGID